ncbi:MAG: hypothetical protein HY690_05220 [Chloroflexi bacterium]|nr:hypothetical protein [Chloroflexota bacterium]
MTKGTTTTPKALRQRQIVAACEQAIDAWRGYLAALAEYERLTGTRHFLLCSRCHCWTQAESFALGPEYTPLCPHCMARERGDRPESFR